MRENKAVENVEYDNQYKDTMKTQMNKMMNYLSRLYSVEDSGIYIFLGSS